MQETSIHGASIIIWGVHYGKTNSFVVGSKHMTSANESISITINEHITESVNAQKHLCITTDRATD